MKAPFIIYANTESLFKEINTFHSKPENSLITKINKHTACSHSLFRRCSFDTTKKQT